MQPAKLAPLDWNVNTVIFLFYASNQLIANPIYLYSFSKATLSLFYLNSLKFQFKQDTLLSKHTGERLASTVGVAARVLSMDSGSFINIFYAQLLTKHLLCTSRCTGHQGHNWKHTRPGFHSHETFSTLRSRG